MNNAQEEILTKLFEECAEVIQVCAKAQMHGFSSMSPKNNPENFNNRDLLEQECGDVLAMILLNYCEGNIDITNIVRRAEEKIKKLGNFTYYTGQYNMDTPINLTFSISKTGTSV